MHYAILQEPNSTARTSEFAVIWGAVAPAGYPIGYEGKDWGFLNAEYRHITIEKAREVLAELVKVKS